jgi:hypothetical protein
VQYREISLKQAGFLASLPFLAAFCGVLCSGFASDFLVRRGASLGVARKTPIVTGLLLSTSIIGANYWWWGASSVFPTSAARLDVNGPWAPEPRARHFCLSPYRRQRGIDTRATLPREPGTQPKAAWATGLAASGARLFSGSTASQTAAPTAQTAAAVRKEAVQP